MQSWPLAEWTAQQCKPFGSILPGNSSSVLDESAITLWQKVTTKTLPKLTTAVSELIKNSVKLVILLHFIWLKKTPNDAVTPQRQSQFTPKMKANAVPHLLSSLVWIDQYNECNRMTSFMEFMFGPWEWFVQTISWLKATATNINGGSDSTKVFCIYEQILCSSAIIQMSDVTDISCVSMIFAPRKNF